MRKTGFMIFLIFAGSIAVLFFLSITGNVCQTYTDIVMERVNLYPGNKVAEKNLLFGLTFSGIVIYFIYALKQTPREQSSEIALGFSEKRVLLNTLALIFVSYLLVLSAFNAVVTGLIVYLLIIYIIKRPVLADGFYVYLFSIYTIFSIYRLRVFLGSLKSENVTFAAIIALALSVIPLFFKNTEKIMRRMCLLEEIFFPALLLIYLSDRYRTPNGEISIIPPPAQVTTTIGILFLIFVFESILNIKKYWNTPVKINEIITYGLCVSIIAFNRFCGTGAVMSTDMHHPFENIIGFSQIFELGQKPFESYIPISGIYSILQGAFFKLFGNGEFSNYNAAEDIFYIFIIILMVALFKPQLNPTFTFLLCLTFTIVNYNRTIFILPIMLILSSEKLIAHKNRWLLTWFLTSLFHGLYYPLFGVAVCAAFLPLGIWQIATYFTSGEAREDIKTFKFWAGWGISGLLVILTSQYLLGTLRHILAMSAQSIFADGIPRFGQAPPSAFFPYLSFELRTILFYVFTWMFPISFVWISFAVFVKAGGFSCDGKKIKIKSPKDACLTISMVIMPVICYTYTFIRLDYNSVYARNTGILCTGIVILLVFTQKYLKNSNGKYLVICFLLFIPFLERPYFSFSSQLEPCYSVPDGYLYVDKDPVRKIGTGYIDQAVYESIQSFHNNYKERDPALSYMGLEDFGYYYLLDLKGDGPLQLFTVKGFSAAAEAVDYARKNDSVIIFPLNSFEYYYFYHWLVTSGEYIWIPETCEFIPSDGKLSREEILEQNKNLALPHIYDGMCLFQVPGIFGSSFETLQDIFSSLDADFSINRNGSDIRVDFKTPLNGKDFDYLYVEFEDAFQEDSLFSLYGNIELSQEHNILTDAFMKKGINKGIFISAWWSDENNESHNLTFEMRDGKLLIPLGAGLKWLLNEHNYIYFTAFKDSEAIATPEINTLKFLKLREVS